VPPEDPLEELSVGVAEPDPELAPAEELELLAGISNSTLTAIGKPGEVVCVSSVAAGGQLDAQLDPSK
jgi:hypothetical protein